MSPSWPSTEPPLVTITLASAMSPFHATWRIHRCGFRSRWYAAVVPPGISTTALQQQPVLCVPCLPTPLQVPAPCDRAQTTPARAPAHAGSGQWPEHQPNTAGIAHRRRQRARQPTLAAPEHPSRPAPTPAPPDRALNPAPYRNLGARRAQPTQAPHSTGSDRPQPQHEAPRPPNGPNPLKKDHFFCARGMNQRVGRGRQFLQ